MALNLQGLPTTNLQTGATGPAVQQLQRWLVANGYMKQADVNTGYGTYGPKTTAAVLKLQNDLGVSNASGPGDFGPQTIAKIQQSTSSINPPAGNVPNPSIQPKTGPTSKDINPPAGATPQDFKLTSTGNANLDAIQQSLQPHVQQLNATGQLPANLEITPAITAQFLSWAHQNVDPQTQQYLSNEAANINAALQDQQTQYNINRDQTVQNFGTSLASQDNAAGNAGVAFSGGRGRADQNLVNDTNRNLESLQSTAAAKAGDTLRTGASQVGSANTNLFNLPTFAGSTVGTGGTQYGTVNATGNANLNYDPSAYAVGQIPTTQYTALTNNQAGLQKSYFDTAIANSSRSVNDIFGLMKGLPAGAASSAPNLSSNLT